MPERRLWHWSSAPPAVPAPRLPGIEVVDAVTKMAHRVSPDELSAGHRRGNYVAFCGERVLAAALVEPGRGRCQGVCVVSEPVHLVSAGEVSRGWSTSVAVCGEVVTGGLEGGENPRYCAACVWEAIRWRAVAGESVAVPAGCEIHDGGVTRSVLREVITLAERAPMLTSADLRARLLGLADLAGGGDR